MTPADPETTATPSMRDRAREYARMGWMVFPLHAPDASKVNGCTCSNLQCSQIGKHPRTAHGFLDATTDPAQVDRLWAPFPDANIGVRTGAASGIIALDVDVRHGGFESLAALQEQIGPIPPTVTVKTGSGGRHYLYKHPGFPVQNDASGKVGKGIDVRGDGGYIVGPYSVHASGSAYEWIGTAPLASLTQPWLDKLPQPKEPTLRLVQPQTGATDADGEHWLDQALLQASPGNRNDTAFWLACQLRDAGFSLSDATPYLERYASYQASDFQAQEARHAGDQAFKRPPREPAKSAAGPAPLFVMIDDTRRVNTATGEISDTPLSEAELAPRAYEWTDLGNADRFADAYRETLVWCRFGVKTGTWREWDDSRWVEAPVDRIMSLAGSTARAMYLEASDNLGTDAGRGLAKWAMKSQAEARLGAMVELAKNSLGTWQQDYDTDPWLLNCLNGTLCLTTATLRPPAASDLITKITLVNHEPDALCPIWDAFLERVQPDPAMRAYIQRAFGYTLTASTREQCLFFSHGVGANGKSTMLTALGNMLGEYGKGARPETFMAKPVNVDGGGANNDIAALAGARGVVVGEVDDGKRFAEGAIKNIIDNKKVTARFLHQEFFDFEPSAKFWMQGNHKPVIRGTDDGIWRRIRLLPFLEVISDEERDKSFDDRLKTEMAGILAWAVRGCAAWMKDGLGEPPAVTLATKAYRAEMDTLAAFLDERCDVTKGLSCTKPTLYAVYRSWAKDGEEFVQSATMFNRRLSERGFKDRILGPNRSWLGIGIKVQGERF